MKTIFKQFLPLATVALLFLVACETSENGEENGTAARERVVAVETMVINEVAFEDRIRVNGNVAAFEDAMISVETPGQVLFVTERGTQVRKGDIILRLDDRMLRSGYQAAKTGFDLADDMYNRQAVLYADSVISTLQYLQSKAQRDQAAAQLSQIEKQLSDAQLRAPFAGRIEERLTSVGQFVGPGTPVLRLVNTSKVKITGGVPERYAGQIKQNTPVEIQFGNYGLETINARIGFAGNLIHPDSRTYPVEVVIDNTDGNIKPLMLVDMRVTKDQLDASLIIPRTALVRDERGLTVFVVRGAENEARAEMRRVEVAITSGEFVAVSSGLTAGESIVVSGLNTLGDGDRINITSSTANSAAVPVSER